MNTLRGSPVEPGLRPPQHDVGVHGDAEVDVVDGRHVLHAEFYVDPRRPRRNLLRDILALCFVASSSRDSLQNDKGRRRRELWKKGEQGIKVSLAASPESQNGCSSILFNLT